VNGECTDHYFVLVSWYRDLHCCDCLDGSRYDTDQKGEKAGQDLLGFERNLFDSGNISNWIYGISLVMMGDNMVR